MMSAEPVNGRGVAAVVDLWARRASEAVPSVAVRVHRSGSWTVVEVEGEMDVQVVALVADLVGVDTTRVVFDLQRVTFMDAAGLSAVGGSIRHRAMGAGGSVRLVAPSRSARRLLMLAGCARVFPAFDSLEEAMSAPLGTGSTRSARGR
ncbi:hypothetical protein GCM10023350_08040 [Nocardioides endophyticus]|uniref:STAS domain-containing protein n=2 Tax=Nocardioides endophyticus TaxID=1353775 RepID=A0ABP8YE66_9ACTN